MTWPFANLSPLSFDFIMADPPWCFETRSEAGKAQKSPERHYDTMTMADIAALPVGDLGRGDAVLWLWATHPMIDQQIEVCRRWGFKFVTTGVWVKRTSTGKLSFGTGYRLRSASEPFIIGTLGRPETVRNIRTVVEGQVREHSRKPDEAYSAAERMMPGAMQRADLFSRQFRLGWSAWGDETGKFTNPSRDGDAGHHPPEGDASMSEPGSDNREVAA